MVTSISISATVPQRNDTDATRSYITRNHHPPLMTLADTGICGMNGIHIRFILANEVDANIKMTRTFTTVPGYQQVATKKTP